MGWATELGPSSRAQAWNPGQVTLFDKVFIWNLMKIIGWGRRGRQGAAGVGGECMVP
jgi:hypothetical protein